MFNEVYAPSTLGIFLREFTFGHTKQLAAVAREHLIALAARTPLLAGADERMFLDIDSLLRPVYGHAKQAPPSVMPRSPAARCCGWACPTDHHHLHGDRRAGDRRAQLRSGKAASARCRIPAQAGDHHRESDQPDAPILVRGDSMFGTKKVITTCIQRGAEFSLSISRNKRINAAIAAIDEAAWTRCTTRRGRRPRHRALISDAQVAETPYTLRLAAAEH
ncbi:putative tnpC [Mycobacterium xenopi 4042]|uniref:Putative tnpC n=1 Tax=Mycobacterium xenopi 4042 TaxID=1299334 RepID=X7YUL1_MYCXE|nr:putative tnpC [Mycobacterium xenopi 4042]